MDPLRLERALRMRGARLTQSRRVIMAVVARLRGHITVSEIHRRLPADAPSVNASTIYRTVEWLCEIGLLQRTHSHLGVAMYHHAHVKFHKHLLCRHCGRDQEIRFADFDVLVHALRERYDFLMDVTQFDVTGACADCVAAGLTTHT